MLRLLLGRSGTGKTTRLYAQMADLVTESAVPLILLVPEQFSFESERALLQRMGPRGASRVQVLSFTRLADTVFREVGGVAGRRMDDGIRALLMSRALETVADQLTLYRRQAADPDYLSAALAMLAECKQCGIAPDDLAGAADTLPAGGTLGQKLREIALILGAYEAIAGERPETAYIDPLDDLTLLARRLPESHVLDGACVFVDSFKSFTAQEMAVMACVLQQAAEVTVALACDTLEDRSGGYGRFSTVIRTANRLVSLAQERKVRVAGPVYLTDNHRTASPALKRLEAYCFLPLPPDLDMADPDDRVVTVAACTDAYAECAFVAREIRRLLREEGGHCRDYAVVARHLDIYRGLIDTALVQEDIPYFLDQREDILTDPLITLVLSALRCVTGGWDTEDLLRVAKTGLAGLAPHSVAQLENYAFLWRIDGRRWRQPFTDNPLGLSAPMDEAADKKLAAVERLRRRLVEPLRRLQGALIPGPDGPLPDGIAFARAIVRYLGDLHADRLVRLQVARLDNAGEHALADRAARLWEVLMGLLDKMAAALAGTHIPADRLAELFRLAAQNEELGSIPQGLDAVQVGAADRVRFAAPRTVFLLGANEGVFPAAAGAAGILSDAERRRLIDLGLPLADAADRQIAEERFIAYAALSAPSHRLYVSYLTSGENPAPSILVETVRRLVPGRRERSIPLQGSESIESAADAFTALALGWDRPDDELTATLHALFADQPAYHARLTAIGRAVSGKQKAFTDATAAQRLFGGDMRLSPSRVEAYHQCRFGYFCRYGLHAQPRRPADLDAAAFGTLTHYVMEQLLPVYTARGFQTIRREEAFTDATRTVERYIEEHMGGLANKTSRFQYLVTRLTRTAGTLLWQVVRELRQSRFVPTDFELAIGLSPEEGRGRVEPLTLTLPDGAQVRMQGKVDRVDVYRDGGVSYVRVVDYKTGARRFRLAEVVEGLNLQMLIYLLSIWENGADRYGEVRPAGVLYLPARLPAVRAPRGTDEEEADLARTRALRMNGLILDDPAVIQAMEADAAGVFIPVRLNRKGEPDKGASLASLAQFGMLKQRVETLLADMAATLRGGDIAALPAQSDTVDACAYCDYRAVCGHEADDPVRLLADRDAAEVLRDLEHAKNPGSVPETRDEETS